MSTNQLRGDVKIKYLNMYSLFEIKQQMILKHGTLYEPIASEIFRILF